MLNMQKWWNAHRIIVHGLLGLWSLSICAGLWLL
jgi:hypothetical protein